MSTLKKLEYDRQEEEEEQTNKDCAQSLRSKMIGS